MLLLLLLRGRLKASLAELDAKAKLVWRRASGVNLQRLREGHQGVRAAGEVQAEQAALSDLGSHLCGGRVLIGSTNLKRWL